MGFTSGLNTWLLCSLMNGGYTLIQHYEIRFLLKKAGYTPGKLTALLNGAVQCRLLRLINSSFIFTDRWLLDYFANSVPSEDAQIFDNNEPT